MFNKKKLNNIIKKHIAKYELTKYKDLVLGCTHYELVGEIFKKYCKNTNIIYNSSYIINELPTINSKELNIQYITTRQSKNYVEKLNNIIKGWICVEFMVM